MSRMAAAPMLPLRVGHENGRYVVTSNDTPSDSTIQPGMELLSVNRKPITAVVGAIAPKLSPDGFGETLKPWRLARGFAQNYWLYVEQTPTFTVVARTSEGREVTATLPGVTSAERTRHASGNRVNATMAANVARRDGASDTISLTLEPHISCRSRSATSTTSRSRPSSRHSRPGSPRRSTASVRASDW